MLPCWQSHGVHFHGPVFAYFNSMKAFAILISTWQHCRLELIFAIQQRFVGFEEDKLSGTYRIDLTDFSTEKISDTVFTGMYIFNDSEIYACDKYYRMYRLAFDGSVIESMDWPRSA